MPLPHKMNRLAHLPCLAIRAAHPSRPLLMSHVFPFRGGHTVRTLVSSTTGTCAPHARSRFFRIPWFISKAAVVLPAFTLGGAIIRAHCSEAIAKSLPSMLAGACRECAPVIVVARVPHISWMRIIMRTIRHLIILFPVLLFRWCMWNKTTQ